MTQNASDATLYEANITTTTDTQYLAIYGATSDMYYNFGNGTLAADTWSGNYNNTSKTLDYNKIATSGGASGQTIKVSFSTKDRHIHWTVSSQSYYLHYAENDSGMSGATVQQMTDNEDGTYSYTVSGWDKTKMNMLVNTSSTNVTGTGSSTSLTVTANTGLSVEESSPKENSGYYRMQLSLSSTPQNITFTFNSNTGVLNAAGSLTRYAITAGGDSTGAAGGYKLKVSDGSTTINNYGGTATANFVQNKTLTVTVTPDVNTQKVTAISGCSSVTDNGNGTYSGTFTVSEEATVTATLAIKSSYTVTFSAGSRSPSPSPECTASVRHTPAGLRAENHRARNPPDDIVAARRAAARRSCRGSHQTARHGSKVAPSGAPPRAAAGRWWEARPPSHDPRPERCNCGAAAAPPCPGGLRWAARSAWR